MNALHPICAASIALCAIATTAGAQTSGPISSADAAIDHHLRTDYKNLAPQTWVNALMPAATGAAADTVPALSAEQLLQRALAGYTRAALDRGGWRNAWVMGDRYAAGEPLLAAAVGSGVTSVGAVIAEPTRHFAAR